jgi:hypothetical protein
MFSVIPRADVPPLPVQTICGQLQTLVIAGRRHQRDDVAGLAPQDRHDGRWQADPRRRRPQGTEERKRRGILNDAFVRKTSGGQRPACSGLDYRLVLDYPISVSLHISNTSYPKSGSQASSARKPREVATPRIGEDHASRWINSSGPVTLSGRFPGVWCSKTR